MGKEKEKKRKEKEKEKEGHQADTPDGGLDSTRLGWMDGWIDGWSNSKRKWESYSRVHVEMR